MSLDPIHKIATGDDATASTLNAPLIEIDAALAYLESVCQQLQAAIDVAVSTLNSDTYMLRAWYANSSTSKVDSAYSVYADTEDYAISGDDIAIHLNDLSIHSGQSLSVTMSLVATVSLGSPAVWSYGGGYYQIVMPSGSGLSVYVSVDSGVTWIPYGFGSVVSGFINPAWWVKETGGYTVNIYRIVQL